MAIVEDRHYRQLLTAAVAKRQREIQDIVYNATPLTRILRDQGRIQVKRAGGPELRVPVEFEKLQAQWFTGYDKIEITPKELLNSAVFNWSRVVGMFSLTGTELLFTRGEEEVIDLMSFYVRAAEKSVKEEWETSIVADGTGNGGRQMIGFGGAIPIVPNTGVYGGIDRAEVANWRTSTFNATTDFTDIGTAWDSTTARPIIERIALNRSRNGQYPDLWIFDALSYQAVSASFVAHQRLATERSARLGYNGLAYHTPAGLVDLVAAGGVGNVMPANTVFGIDTSALSIYEFPGQSFVPFHPGDGMRPINQDAVAQGIVWSGQLVLENPLFTVRLITA
ncbi:phage major capsid protein [Chelativorans oligotrophicus]|uniref:phage major capsid protein n=1 Tax=Chelativorans oligotrophicus TaxID=449974 RepID=UPI001409DA37|nr:phage major capsid protein [Chelativorans oligotrophicus]